MKFRIENKTSFFLYLIVIAIISILIIFYINAQKGDQTASNIEHTQEIIRKNDKILVYVLSIESSSRGYVLTGDINSIKHFDEYVKKVNVDINELERITKDNPHQQLKVRMLKIVVSEKIIFADSVNDVRATRGLDRAKDIVKNSRGVFLTEQIRKIIVDINNEELRLLGERKKESANNKENSVYIFLFLLIIVVFVLLLVSILLKNEKAKNLMAEGLKKSNNLFLGFFNNNPASIIISRLDDGKIVNINECSLNLFGFSNRDEVIGQTLEELNLFEDLEFVKKIARTLTDNQPVRDFETSIKTRHDETKWISASVLLMEVDNRSCLFSVLIDITHRKKTEEQLLAVNKELETFTYSVSHDLRAPLRAINGYANIIIEDYSPLLDADGKKSLNAILLNSKKMGDLIDDLLAFSRLGRKVILTSEINMTGLIKSVREEVMIGNTGNVEFIIPELLPAKGQQALIKQVWINLFSNAIKFSAHMPKTIIEVGSYGHENHVVYSIKDNGAGFDMKYYDKLFGIFQRLHSQEEFEGTGIGLAIVKKIVEHHDGKVWAESELNKGTCFYFSLPGINS